MRPLQDSYINFLLDFCPPMQNAYIDCNSFLTHAVGAGVLCNSPYATRTKY